MIEQYKSERYIDLLLVLFALVFFSPIVLVLALCIKAFMGRPVLYSQMQPCFKGKPFKIIKFRTITNERYETGELLPDRDRLTNIGKFLKSTPLDELPEILNVLKGDLSIVGPRPSSRNTFIDTARSGEYGKNGTGVCC